MNEKANLIVLGSRLDADVDGNESSMKWPFPLDWIDDSCRSRRDLSKHFLIFWRPARYGPLKHEVPPAWKENAMADSV